VQGKVLEITQASTSNKNKTNYKYQLLHEHILRTQFSVSKQ